MPTSLPATIRAPARQPQKIVGPLILSCAAMAAGAAALAVFVALDCDDLEGAALVLLLPSFLIALLLSKMSSE